LSHGFSNIVQTDSLYASSDAINRASSNELQRGIKRAGFEGVSGIVDGPEVLLFGAQQLKK
jgi:hypothetical protein